MVKTIMPTMNGGELSRRMEGRVDLDGIYDRGFREMYNFVPTVEGPAAKRPGFRFIRRSVQGASYLTPFIFNQTQAYVLEWSEQRIRFYTNGGRIETSPTAPYEVATPFFSSEAPLISRWQSFDRQYLAHRRHRPSSLARTGAGTFAWSYLALKNGPFKTQNANEAVTVTATGTTGSVTLTATQPIFQAGHVGTAFLLEAKDFSDVTAWEPGYDGVVVGAKRRSDGKVYQAATAGKTGTVQPTHTEGTEYDGAATGNDINGKAAGGIRWTYLYDRYGQARISSVASDGLSATVDVERRLADSLTTAGSFRWAHSAFSDVEGYPHLVCVWAGRLIFFKGLELYASVVGDYLNFAYFTDGGLFAPDMAFHRTLSATDEPIWLKADQQLLVGTPSGELLVGAVNAAAAISGDNVQALPQSGYGSAGVEPVDIGTGLLFVQRGGRKVREAEYDFQRNRFVGVNLTIYARHITRSGLVQLAYQQEPEEMVWGVRRDGLMIAHAHSPEQQVKGWSRIALGQGVAQSICSVPSPDGLTDEIWILATLGSGQQSVLQLTDWWQEDEEATEDEQYAKLQEAFFVDWGVSYRGDPRAHFTQGLEHLAGRDVRILADGGVVSGRTVNNAGVLVPDLDEPASVVHIGLGYQARLRPMRIELRGAGTAQGKRKRIVKLMLRLIDTAAAILVNNKGNRELVLNRPTTARMDRPVPLFNGDSPVKGFDGGYDRDGQPLILSDDPLPMMVSAIMPDVEVEN